jgi:two-component system response regulator FlrC
VISAATISATAETDPASAADAAELAPVAESPAMREALRAVQEVASTPTTVLLLGAPGSGRARLARHLHALSARPGACVTLHCQADDRALGGLRAALSAAARGTLILRDVDTLRAPAQAVLVRALQDRPDDPPAPRIVATASPELASRAAAGAFRSELFYRLNVFPVAVPPLVERPEDLAGLAASLLREDAGPGDPLPALAEDALAALLAHPFPQGVTELARLLRQARRPGAPVITADDLFGPRPATPRPAFPEALPLDLAQLERLAIEEALRRAGGNRTQAAKLLRIGLRTLRNKLRAWREAGEEVPPSPHATRQELPARREPGAGVTAAILAHPWARPSQERSA